jgi:hypothetical protein
LHPLFCRRHTHLNALNNFAKAARPVRLNLSASERERVRERERERERERVNKITTLPLAVIMRYRGN